MTQEHLRERPTATGRVPGVRGQATRARLIDAVGTLLETTSYRDLGVAAIARQANTSSATFYHYFEDLGAAIEELAERMLLEGAELATVVREEGWGDDDPLPWAGRLVDAFFTFWQANRALIRVVELLAEEGDPRFQRIRRRILLDLTRSLADAIEENTPPEQRPLRPDPLAGAVALISMMSHVATYRDELRYWKVSTEDSRDYIAQILAWVVTHHDPAEDSLALVGQPPEPRP